MTNRIAFEKSLTASSAVNICASQTGIAATLLSLNGTATNFLSTTTTAATTPVPTSTNNPFVLKVSSTTGVVVGQVVTDVTTPSALVTGTKVVAIGTGTVTIYPPVTGDGSTGATSGVGSGDTLNFLGTATIDTATATNTAIGRRVTIAYTGTDTTFTITGTNSFGNAISEVVTGSSGAATSALDYVTVTSITPTGGGLSGVTAGTTSTGSSPWWIASYTNYPPMNVAAAVELVSGSATYSVEYTYDDPNNLTAGLTSPLALTSSTPAALVASSTTHDGNFTFPLVGLRLTITAGSGVLRARFEQAGVG